MGRTLEEILAQEKPEVIAKVPGGVVGVGGGSMMEEHQLPPQWVRMDLGLLLSGIQSGKSVRCDERAPINSEKGLVKISAVTWGQFNENESKTLLDTSHLLSSHKIKKGDLLMSRANTLELVGASVRVSDINKNLYLSDKVLRLETRDEFKPLIHHFLKSTGGRKQIESLATGNQLSMRNISQGAIRAIQIPVAPLAEQKVIADKLDSLLAQVETTKARLDRIPDILKRFRQSVLAAAVSGRLTEEWREVIECPSWESVVLEEVADIKDPHPSHRTPKAVTGGIPYIGIGDLKGDGTIDFENARKVSSDILREHNERYVIKDGDFVFGKIGTLGKATFLPVGIDYTLSANVILIQPKLEKVVPAFLMYFLSAPSTLDEVSKQANSTSQAAFGIKKMRVFATSLPPLEEQTEIVRRVEQLFTYADTIEQQVQAASARVNNLTQSILAKAFRGELTQDWRAANPDLISGDNSAAALLEKIKAERAAMKPKKKVRVKKVKV